jgi:branched-chain amino acid transport system permease protein
MSKQIITHHLKLIGLIVLIVIIALLPLFVHSPYYLDLLIMIIVNAILAMTFIMLLRTGLISLGIAAFWGMGAYLSTVLVMKLNLSFWFGLPASALITGFIALCLGYPLIKNAGFSFVILTAVIGMIFVVAIGNIPQLGGYTGIPNIPPPDPIRIPFLPPIEFASKIPFFYLALFLFVVAILITSAFYSAWTGRAWTAIGLNPRLAGSLGINVFRYRLLAFVLASALAGLIGSFYAHYQGFVIPSTYGLFATIYIHIYAILGGIGYVIAGPVLGSALMTFFPELIRMTKEVAPIFTGALLVLLVLFLPRGLLRLLDRRTVIAESVANKIVKAFESSPSASSRRHKEDKT